MKLLVATKNHGKLIEFRRIYGEIGLEIVGADDVGAGDVEETGDTFEANALLKARAGARASGLWTLADDSGLEVDALGGAPGVRSARYSEGGSEANVRKLLEALRDVPDAQRTARFRCVLALVDPAAPDAAPTLVSGACEGHIARAPRGAGGFGYDPVFVPAGRDVTIAELGDAEKDALSHRGVACERMRPALARLTCEMPPNP